MTTTTEYFFPTEIIDEFIAAEILDSTAIRYEQAIDADGLWNFDIYFAQKADYRDKFIAAMQKTMQDNLQAFIDGDKDLPATKLADAVYDEMGAYIDTDELEDALYGNNGPADICVDIANIIINAGIIPTTKNGGNMDALLARLGNMLSALMQTKEYYISRNGQQTEQAAEVFKALGI